MKKTSDGQPVPFPDYGQLDAKQISDRLAQLSQVELAAVETYESAHENRPAVLEKLRYMQGSEPLPGYDTLTTEQIAEAMAGSDAETVKAVRDYERKFQHRQAVLTEASRVLPTSPASAREKRSREAKAKLLREGYADRERTAPDQPE
jgi:D-serine deaminase-like pyridoxal phosphate-dependent protein